ncbi:MAG: hypothetical protein ABI723_10600 [Bacteroidia bacterium]
MRAIAEDHFERYYAEKLWETIPSIYRHEDGIAAEPGVLRALVQVLAKQAAILRRSQDHLWDDQFIEICNEWAVPYIGDLVATRLLSALNKRGRRIDVAKTIYYRRRKGTPRILEELISDITGWEGKLVEQFQKLGRSRHGLDPQPGNLAGRYSGTLPGGWADLRNQRISELTNGPFEEYFHTPDMRLHNGLNGRYAIPKLAFYLYRLTAFPAVGVTPFALSDGLSFTFDPSGRDIPLFSKRFRPTDWDWDQWHSAFEWELPAPIPCRLLGHAEYSFAEEIIQKLIDNGLSPGAAVELSRLSGLRFKNEGSLINILETFTNKIEILDPKNFMLLLSLALVTDCGKQALLPDANTNLDKPLQTSSIAVGFGSPFTGFISVEDITAARLDTWTVVTNKELAIDAEKGRFKFSNPPAGDILVAYNYGFSGTIGAGTYDRSWIKKSKPDKNLSKGGIIISSDLMDSGIAQIDDSRTYGPVPDQLNVINLVLQSENNQRPYLRLEDNWVFDSGANMNSVLTLDGLWIGSVGNLINKAIILRGDYECVVIKNCTLDPGGSVNAKNETLFPLTLSIEGNVENLCLESSILGPVKLESTGNVEEVYISDCIIQSIDTTIKALQLDKGKVNIQRTTIFGDVDVHRLEASETLVTRTADVTDTQNGCFRFSAAPVNSRLPHPYESFLFEKDSNYWFTSHRFGDPGFAQLSDAAPKNILRGAENGSEIGAFSHLLNPIKLEGLRSKIDEYMPFGLIPIFINKT